MDYVGENFLGLFPPLGPWAHQCTVNSRLVQLGPTLDPRPLWTPSPSGPPSPLDPPDPSGPLSTLGPPALRAPSPSGPLTSLDLRPLDPLGSPEQRTLQFRFRSVLTAALVVLDAAVAHGTLPLVRLALVCKHEQIIGIFSVHLSMVR